MLEKKRLTALFGIMFLAATTLLPACGTAVKVEEEDQPDEGEVVIDREDGGTDVHIDVNDDE